MNKNVSLPLSLALLLTFSACSAASQTSVSGQNDATSDIMVSKEEIQTDSEDVTMDDIFELTKGYKTRGNTNPIMTQEFGADPFALVVGDEVYIYMTADAFEYDEKGELKENTYSKIKTIHVVSTKDFKNFTDHGEIPVAGSDGIAKWAHNSWAPAAAMKEVDGKMKCFLYFADNGGGIGVLEAESPTGPFVDPIGKALIDRNVPTCDKVLWLFDPAVLVDDDGSAYIYFGGGVPQGKEEFPGTARVAKLSDDMIHLASDPVLIDAPCLFEDSGIHKYNNKYYYTYCTNWTVSPESTQKYGFTNGEIACMMSDSPMGPFTYVNKILENPGTACGLYGNNHHAIFEFNGQQYICYHSRCLERHMGLEHGYRATFINEVTTNPDGTIKLIRQSKEGIDQLFLKDAYAVNSSVCVSQMVGTNSVPLDKSLGYKDMALGELNTGDFTETTGVDFSDIAPKSVTVTAKADKGVKGSIYLRIDFPNKPNVCRIDIEGTGEFTTYTADLREEVTGVHFLYFVFYGEGFEVKDWQFNK